MSMRYAVLGLVIEEPDHGYRLAQRLRQRLGAPELQRNYVYGLLKQLAREDLICRIPAEQRAARSLPRVVFEATAKGVEQFDEWMGAAAPLTPSHDELHVKLVLSRSADLPRLIELTFQQERECLDRLQELERSQPAPPAGRSAGGWPRVAAVLVRNADTAQLQTTVRWLQRARAVMERLQEDRRHSQGPRATPAARSR